MKTYWLHSRLKPLETQFLPTPSFLEPAPSIDPLTADKLLDAADTRSLYSPVTFEEVSRYSPIMSPTSSTISDILPATDSSKRHDSWVSSHVTSHHKGNVSGVICFGVDVVEQ